MHFYDHYHDPNTHLQLTRQREDELLRSAKRRYTEPGLLVRLRVILHRPVPARPAGQEVTIP